MGGIIITMPKYEDANKIGDIIRRSDIWEEPVISTMGSETLRLVEDRDISLVICTKKFSDMGYEELSNYLPSSVNMILLTQDASLIPFSSNIVRLLMPFRSGDLINTVNMLLGDNGYRTKKKIKRSDQDKKVIDQAKQVLMVRNGMSEPEAFRYIQKTSMDTGRSMVESAQMILMMNSE